MQVKTKRKRIISLTVIFALLLTMALPIYSMANDSSLQGNDIDDITVTETTDDKDDTKLDGTSQDSTGGTAGSGSNQSVSEEKVKTLTDDDGGDAPEYTFTNVEVSDSNLPEYYSKSSNSKVFIYKNKDGETLYRVYGKLNTSNDSYWYASDENGNLFKPYSALNQTTEKNNALDQSGAGSRIEEDLEDDKARVNSLKATKIVDGTQPWDTAESDGSADKAGNDSSPSNKIVRTFDQVYYTLSFSTVLQNQEKTTYYKNGYMHVKFELPKTTYAQAKFDMDAMNWLLDGKQEEVENADGTTSVVLTGKRYIQAGDKASAIPGEGELSVVVKVLGMKNGDILKPKFTVWMQGNDESKYRSAVADDVKVSAAPSYNIRLTSLGNYKDVFDFNSGESTAPNFGKGNLDGRLYKYGISLQLRHANVNKKFKGIELPDGKITFDVDMKVEKATTDITGTGANQSMPLLWEYKANSTSANGQNGRSMRYAPTAGLSMVATGIPLNKGSAINAAPDGGTWAMSQTGSKISVTVDAYEFLQNGDYRWATHGYNSSAPSYGNDYGIASFSTAYFQVAVPFPDDMENEGANFYFTVEDNNMSAKSITGQTVNNDNQVIKNDDRLKSDLLKLLPGSYSKSNMGTKYPGRFSPWSQTLSSSVHGMSGDGAVRLGQEVRLFGQYSTSTNNDPANVPYALNLLQKFDSKVFQPLDSNDENSYDLHNQGAGTIKLKLRYGVLDGGRDWASDSEMNSTFEESLEFFPTMADLKSKYPSGKCVAVLVEGRGGNSYDYQYIGFPAKVADDAEVGHVAQMVNDLKIWTKAVGSEMTEQHSVLSKNNPGAYEAMPNHNVFLNGNVPGYGPYVKTEYDEQGLIKTGTHAPKGRESGASFLVLGEVASIAKSVDQVSSTKSKVNYDVGIGERRVDYVLYPKLQLPEGQEGTADIASTVTITDTLPKGVAVSLGTKYYQGGTYTQPTNNPNSGVLTGATEIELAEPPKENADGTTTLKWVLKAKAGEEIEPIRYSAFIGTPGDSEKDVTDGQQLTNKATIQSTNDMRAPQDTFGNLAKYTIGIINLKQSSLTKMIKTPKVEVEEDLVYTISYSNVGTSDITNYKLLDILPFNGDSRGSKFDGNYDVKVHLDLAKATENSTSIELKSSTSDSVRGKDVTTFDESSFAAQGTAVKKGESQSFTLPAGTTALKLGGTLGPQDEYIMTVTLEPTNNSGGNVYANDATASMDGTTEYIYAPVVSGVVVKRDVSGIAWFDNNIDGLIDKDEPILENVKVTLRDSSGNVAKDVKGVELAPVNTDVNGAYKFNDLPQGDYRVEFEGTTGFQIQNYKITLKGEGSDYTKNSDIIASPATGVLNKGIIEKVTLPEIEKVSIYGYTSDYNNAGFTATPIEYELNGTKELAGRDLDDSEFKFNVLDTDGNQVTTGTADKNGKITFADKLKFTGYGIFKYHISEVNNGLNGVEYDKSIAVVTIEVDYNNTTGKLSVKSVKYEKNTEGTVATAAGINFTNSYSTNSVTYEPAVLKSIIGGTPSALSAFKFAIEGVSENAPMPVGSVGNKNVVMIEGEGSVSLGAITFIKEGTYEYNVTEEIGSAEGYTYAQTVFNLKIIVKDDPKAAQLYIDQVLVDDDAEKEMKFENEYENPAPGMLVEKTAGKDKIKVGEKLEYTIKVTNTGNRILHNVVIRDDIPKNTSYDSSKDGGVYVKEGNAKYVKWELGDLATGESKTVRFTVIVHDCTSTNNIVTNVATASSDETPTVDGKTDVPAEGGDVLGETAGDPGAKNTVNSNEVGTVLGEDAKTSDSMQMGILIIALLAAITAAITLIKRKQQIN